MQKDIDNFTGCCGANTYHPVGEEIYCTNCDEFSVVVDGSVEFDDGTTAPMDRGIIQGEYEPNFKGFVSTVTAGEIATTALVVLMFVSIWFAI